MCALALGLGNLARTVFLKLLFSNHKESRIPILVFYRDYHIAQPSVCAIGKGDGSLNG